MGLVLLPLQHLLLGSRDSLKSDLSERCKGERFEYLYQRTCCDHCPFAVME